MNSVKDQSNTRNATVHRLVCEAFLGPCPEGYECAHNDGVRLNSALSNLRYDTRKGNSADKLAHGTWQGGEKNPAAKLTALKAKAAYTLCRLGWSQQSLAEIFGVERSTISLIARGKKWASVTGADNE